MSTTHALVIKRILPASRDQVFAAWTDPDVMKRWFAPRDLTVPQADVDLRIGGAYSMTMQESDGKTYSPSGTYEEIVPNEKLVFSWTWAHDDEVTRVTVELRDTGDNETELTLTHEGFAEEGVRDHHEQGWNGCLDNFPKAR